MGSPFDGCDLRLEGAWVPKLSNREGWQNLSASSTNGRLLALIAWAINSKNDPGFKIVIIDSKARKVHRGKRIPGCCKSIEWTGTGFSYETFNFIRFKT